MGWTVGILIWRVVHVGTSLVGLFLPVVQWDGMDSRDTDVESGTRWDFPSVSFPSHGTVGWDGQCIGILMWRVV